MAPWLWLACISIWVLTQCAISMHVIMLAHCMHNWYPGPIVHGSFCCFPGSGIHRFHKNMWHKIQKLAKFWKWFIASYAEVPTLILDLSCAYSVLVCKHFVKLNIKFCNWAHNCQANEASSIAGLNARLRHVLDSFQFIAFLYKWGGARKLRVLSMATMNLCSTKHSRKSFTKQMRHVSD